MINNKNNFDENIEEKKYLDTDINILHKNIINNNENHKINIKAKFNDKKLEQNENNNTFNSYIIKKNKLIDNNISLINNIDESIETKANNISNDKMNINDLNDIIPNFPENQITKSRSYSTEAKCSEINNNKTKIINCKKNSYNYNKKEAFSNISIYSENDEKNNDYLKKDFSDELNIDEIMKKTNYYGDKENFLNYLQELKIKSDITTLVQNLYNNDIYSFDSLNRSIENYYTEKNSKILDMYKYLVELLIASKDYNFKNRKIYDLLNKIN